jgi:transcriptional antiterminator
MTGYPLDLLYEEIAFIAYHFHWSQEELMNMEHHQRRRWCEEISRINRQLSDEPQNIFEIGESGAS